MKLQQVKHIVIFGVLFVVVPLVILAIFRKRIFGYILKPEQEKYIKGLNKKLQNKFRRFIDRVEAETDYNVIVTDGYRTFAEQQKEHLADPRNPAPGYSIHNYGGAIDINAIADTSYLRKSTSKETWEKSGIPNIARDMGFTWGGDFPSYYDPVHIGLDREYDVDKLRAIAIAEYGTDWNNIHGNQIQLT